MTEKWPLYLAAFGFYLCILALVAFMSPRRKELKMPRMIIEGYNAGSLMGALEQAAEGRSE